MQRKCTNLPFLVLMQTSKAVHERIKEEMSKNKLNIMEFSVLEVLYQKGKQTIRQIGDYILVSSSSMTYVIDKLEQKGLLSRNACREDRRVVHVTLTDGGNKLMQEIMLKHQKVVDDMFDSLNSDEGETLVHLLKKVKDKV
ncbi:MarR family winged helix-turn-helix transcriptional regulator [Priestia endophytica]|uniref:MarR family transcriptional regulator, 2-MHQ and catechol-resistance regulon repressor n=1 Tax=Priestia endophytica DSM 13796 TaxID=1121089 RepID=A0A1I6BHI6_9BACI|nr:MarR family transcriptional regulator [Priestia endophytica]KYG25769.1 MarR family transcriptional regulator [Priestia endophytica]SFQ80374.1 MarR family transcriptional regulator, 2-MHQ and catechol-resistance regulon repressor [Priestia endophytica DSM 13796]